MQIKRRYPRDVETPREELLRRFELKFIPEPNSGCWLWVGHVHHATDYGWFCISRKPHKAHRVSWMLYRGLINGGLHVCHKCDVQSCVNPDHLFLGTHAENMADMARKGRAAGSLPGTAHNARVSPSDVILIRRSPEPVKVLAKRYGITTASIHNIQNLKTWAHVQ